MDVHAYPWASGYRVARKKRLIQEFNLEVLDSSVQYPMDYPVGMVSQLALYDEKDVESHQLIWRELEVSTHLLKTRGIDPVELEEDGYVGDVVFQPPHTYEAVNRGLGDLELNSKIRTNEEHVEMRRSVSSGGWTNDDYHRNTDVQNVSDGMMFMFDCDAEQPDDHFCQGPLPPDKLPDIVLAPPPQLCSKDAHSDTLPSFGGELFGQGGDTPCQQDSTMKTSTQGELAAEAANEKLATEISTTEGDGHSARIPSFGGELFGPHGGTPCQVALKTSIKGELAPDEGVATTLTNDVHDQTGRSVQGISFFSKMKSKCQAALGKLLCGGRSLRAEM